MTGHWCDILSQPAMLPRRQLVLPALCFLAFAAQQCFAASHVFKAGDPVVLWANKVGPFSNPRCDKNAQNNLICFLGPIIPRG